MFEMSARRGMWEVSCVYNVCDDSRDRGLRNNLRGSKCHAPMEWDLTTTYIGREGVIGELASEVHLLATLMSSQLLFSSVRVHT